MFGGLNDPFGFNGRINSMLNNFMIDPFGQNMGNNNNNSNNNNNNNNQNRNRSNQVSLRNNHFDPFGMMSPFDMDHGSMMARHHQAMSNPFALMNQMMGGGGGFGGSSLLNNFDQMHNDPNAQVFSSSTVMSYSNSGNGKPKVYQSSTQVRQAPGGVKETRQMLRDSDQGIEKVSVGHHIGERAHIIERQKVNGQMEEMVNLENLDDNEINEFNQEFESKLASQVRSSQHHHHHRPHLVSNQPFAIEDGSRANKKERDRKSKSKSKH